MRKLICGLFAVGAIIGFIMTLGNDINAIKLFGFVIFAGCSLFGVQYARFGFKGMFDDVFGIFKC